MSKSYRLRYHMVSC